MMNGLKASLERTLLTPLSWLFRTVVLFRHFLYDKKILKTKYSPLPVVSIGNMMVGGAGKTQVALLLAQELEKEFSTAILSRGYRGRAESASSPLIVDPQRHSAQVCGDEPWLLASRLKSTRIVVNKNRYKSAVCAQENGSQLLILDDGMQHRQLHRNFEIIVIDGKTPFGSFLPRGRLREDLSRLKEGDLIFFIGEPENDLKNSVSRYSAAPQVIAKIASHGLYQLNGEPFEELKDKKVGLFCGIGNPHRFVATIEALGFHIMATHFSADHCLMSEKKLDRFAELCKSQGATCLLCTEKDKVKLPPSKALSLPIVWLKTQLEIINNQSAWLKLVGEIKQLAHVPYHLSEEYKPCGMTGSLI